MNWRLDAEQMKRMELNWWPNPHPLAGDPIEMLTFTPLESTMSIEATLAERGSRYGTFQDQARICQNIKRAFQDSPNWADLADDQKECLDMLANKVGRILNGDPDYHDSWHDIIGYTKLVADRLAA
jgi:hypothetical protein